MLPGIRRTDEPVFNVPRLGKNHVRAAQHRDLLAILLCSRVKTNFTPGKRTSSNAPATAVDIPILDYLAAWRRSARIPTSIPASGIIFDGSGRRASGIQSDSQPTRPIQRLQHIGAVKPQELRVDNPFRPHVLHCGQGPRAVKIDIGDQDGQLFRRPAERRSRQHGHAGIGQQPPAQVVAGDDPSPGEPVAVLDKSGNT